MGTCQILGTADTVGDVSTILGPLNHVGKLYERPELV